MRRLGVAIALTLALGLIYAKRTENPNADQNGITQKYQPPSKHINSHSSQIGRGSASAGCKIGLNGRLDCPEGLRACGDQCCGPKEACCTRSDGTHYCDSGRCP
jgi:hypothetical protein